MNARFNVTEPISKLSIKLAMLDNQPKEMYHLIDYHTLCDNPQETIEGIYNFLDIVDTSMIGFSKKPKIILQ